MGTVVPVRRGRGHSRSRTRASAMAPRRRTPRYMLEYLYPRHAVAGPGWATNCQVTYTRPAAAATATNIYAIPKPARGNASATPATIREDTAIARTAVRSSRVAESIGRPARRQSPFWRNAGGPKGPGGPGDTRRGVNHGGGGGGGPRPGRRAGGGGARAREAADHDVALAPALQAERVHAQVRRGAQGDEPGREPVDQEPGEGDAAEDQREAEREGVLGRVDPPHRGRPPAGPVHEGGDIPVHGRVHD